MSLLLLKTRDLTWQDHTLNVEVMLSPNKSQLLFNKHKTLSTHFNKEVELYQKQINTMMKDLTVEKRLMERHRHKLLTRQKDLSTQRSQSALEVRHKGRADLMDRSKSAPARTVRAPSPPRLPGRMSRGVFLTEIEDEKMSKLPALKTRKSRFQRKIEEPPPTFTFNKPKPKPKFKPRNLGKKRYVTFGVHPVPSESSSESEEEEDEANKEHPLDSKIKVFLDEIKAFNEKPVPQKRFPGSRDLFSYLKDKEEKSEPLAAKKYNTLTVDRQKLEAAFDSFCKSKSREDLVKMMRLAAKMKANAAQSRSNSFMPAITAVRATRTFLSFRTPRPSTSPTHLSLTARPSASVS